MARRVRMHDWSATPLGAIETWPQSLRTAINLMLNARQPTFVLWGPERTFLCNDACLPLLGGRQADALGRFIGEVWPELYEEARELIDPAFDGRPTLAENRRRVVRPDGIDRVGWYTLSYTPIHDESGAVAGVFSAVTDATEHVVAEQRLSFLLHLSEQLRACADPVEITAIAARELAEHLDVARVGYSQVDPSEQSVTVLSDCSRKGLPSVAGTVRPMMRLGPALIDRLRSGRVVRIDDIAADPLTADQAEGYGARGLMVAPLVRGGRFTALIFFHELEPRAWTEGDAALAEDVAARTWSALTRARAEAALLESESRFRAMADQAPAPIWVTSAAGDMEFANQAFGDLAGRDPAGITGDVWIEMLHPEDLPNVLAARASARLHNDPYSFEARFRRPDGGWRTMLASARPRMTPDGVFEGYVGLAIDLTEMRAAEAAMRESEARFRLLAESAPVMLWMGDENGACLYLNRSLREFWGVADDLTGFSWGGTVVEDDHERLFAAITTAMDRREPLEVEARYWRADGQIRTLFTRAEPRHDPEGRFVGMIGVNVDVTEARKAEQHQRLLINELNHRVKNSLATVQSIAHQTLREGMAIGEARDLLTARLLSLSAAHDVLTRESWEGADLGEVVAAALRPYDAARHSAHGPHHRIGPQTALALSMALHELATNALKYGALSGAEGRIAITWILDEYGALVLTWREEGGPPVVAPARTGFGSRLLRQGLGVELGGPAVMRFEPTGLVCVIRARTGA